MAWTCKPVDDVATATSSSERKREARFARWQGLTTFALGRYAAFPGRQCEKHDFRATLGADRQKEVSADKMRRHYDKQSAKLNKPEPERLLRMAVAVCRTLIESTLQPNTTNISAAI